MKFYYDDKEKPTVYKVNSKRELALAYKQEIIDRKHNVLFYADSKDITYDYFASILWIELPSGADFSIRYFNKNPKKNIYRVEFGYVQSKKEREENRKMIKDWVAKISIRSSPTGKSLRRSTTLFWMSLNIVNFRRINLSSI
ncbi:MAG: hypothetical protein Q4D77_04550 [Peptostreptococcaceae bacterium]|nr:hypothetical protein [Peptostreptococcaceae bacterium]